MSRAAGRLALAGAMVLAIAAVASPQQQTATTETKTFEVIAVDGNDLVVKLPEGTKQLTVPADFQFTVDGRQLSVHELQPGMKGTATITTKTTVHPVTVTEVKNGTVAQVSGSSIIVRTDQGYKAFTQGDLDKRGVKIMRGGRPAEISEFHAGDVLTATIITTRPPRVVTEKQVQATLARSAPPAAPPPPASARPAAPASAPASAPVATAGTTPAAQQLPKTASSTPLLGAAGVVLLILGLALRTSRRSVFR
jgi:LPXTG-motif cell wall-anchored protein